MRKTRFMSMLFLVWSIAFFFVADFRQGLHAPFWLSTQAGWEWLVRTGTIPASKLAEAARVAEQQRDARTLAFVALHAPTVQDGVRWADEAVTIDPSLTWVYVSLILRGLNAKQNPPDVQSLVARLEKWDPDNAVPYLFEGQVIAKRKNLAFTGPSPAAVSDNLAKETEWCQAMQKAYAAPRYDDYNTRRFELERTWLRQNHLDKPAIVLLSVVSYWLPNLLQIRTYANLLVDKYGKDAEDAKHLPQALGYYWTAEHFGERMRLSSAALIEKLIAVAVQSIADKRLIPALRAAGQADAATTLEMARQQVAQEMARLGGKDPLAQSVNYNWTALIVAIFAGLVAIFAVLTVVCLLYVNAKRWVRLEIKAYFFQFLTVAENYMPVLFFLACAGLYLSYYPYAQNFHHYMTATGEIHDFEPLFYNVFPNYGGMPGHNNLPVGNPFLPYAWYALVGSIVAVLAFIPYRREPKKQ